MIYLDLNNVFQLNLMYCIIVTKCRVDMIFGDLDLTFKVTPFQGHYP